MEAFNKFDIATTVTDSLIELFDMMLSMKLELSDEHLAAKLDENRIVGSVSLAGRVKGSIIIHVSDPFSRRMAAAMLDAETDAVDPAADVKDVISEVCNIVGGNLKSNFCDIGLTCRLSPPSFTIGSDFKVESLQTSRYERYVFAYQENPIVVEVGVVSDDTADENECQQVLTCQKPIDINRFHKFDMGEVLAGALQEIFDSMLSMELDYQGLRPEVQLESERIVGSVAYAGSLMGALNLYVTRDFALAMTAAMLQVAPDQVEGANDVKDVIGELCNMVGGNLKSKLCDAGLNCEVSTPSFTSGNDFIIKSQHMLRYERHAFRSAEETLLIEAGFTIDEEALPEGARIRSPKPRQRIAQAGSDLSQAQIDELLSGQPAPADPDETPQSESEPPAAPAEALAAVRSLKDSLSGSNLDFILDIPLDITVELGRTKRKISELFELGSGSVVEFANLASEPVDVLVNQKLIARGEIVVENEKYGIRITEIISRLNRIQSLK